MEGSGQFRERAVAQKEMFSRLAGTACKYCGDYQATNVCCVSESTRCCNLIKCCVVLNITLKLITKNLAYFLLSSNCAVLFE